MPTSRSYADACGTARALDVIGERWAMLVVRELLLGPQRYTDLRQALPGASSNLVADRLRELVGRGVAVRRKLERPASSWIYELTGWGRELEPVVVALGTWGLSVPVPAGATLSATSVLLYLRSAARPDPSDTHRVFGLDFGGRTWTVRSEGGRVTVESGLPDRADACLRTDPEAFNALIKDPTRPVDATGDIESLRRLLGSVGAPGRTAA